jgi:hypothetical protein
MLTLDQSHILTFEVNLLNLGFITFPDVGFRRSIFDCVLATWIECNILCMYYITQRACNAGYYARGEVGGSSLAAIGRN